jgi:hypothetical protein
MVDPVWPLSGIMGDARLRPGADIRPEVTRVIRTTAAPHKPSDALRCFTRTFRRKRAFTFAETGHPSTTAFSQSCRALVGIHDVLARSETKQQEVARIEVP